MQLQWGNKITFASNGCEIASRTRLVEYDNRPARYIVRVDVGGWLEGDTQAELSTDEAALRTALQYQDQDLKFYSDAGALMAVSLSNNSSLSGCRVVDGPHFPGDTGAEYATLRRFEFSVEAEYIVRGMENAVLSWTESITITGTGGPVRRFRVPINGPPVRQVISTRSVIKATQSGRAVGHSKRPTGAPPLWPAYEMLDQRQISTPTPKRFGRGFAEFEVSWQYAFESDVPLVGFPSLPPL